MTISSLASIHPASIVPVAQGCFLSEKIRRGEPVEVHPASIPLTTRVVKDGFGELVLRVKEGDTLRPVTKEEYAKAYLIFQKYAPRLEEVPKPLAKSRIEMMREELRTINPNMIATFIPRTLYELVFIRNVIQEDLERAKKVTFKDAMKPTDREQMDLYIACDVYGNSWCNNGDGKQRLKVTRPSFVDTKRFIDLGERLNTALCQMLAAKEPRGEHLTLGQLQDLVNEQIHFLSEFYKTPVAREIRNMPLKKHQKNALGPTFFFALSMGLKSEKEMQIIRNAAFLECLELSIGKIIAYRGGYIAKDTPDDDGYGDAYSLSFGSGLFPGTVNDLTACATHYMFERQPYALVLDPTLESSRVIHIFPFTALESLFGCGETFHLRFKCGKNEKRTIRGVDYTGEGFEGMSTTLRNSIVIGSLSRKRAGQKFDDLKKHNLVVLIP